MQITYATTARALLLVTLLLVGAGAKCEGMSKGGNPYGPCQIQLKAPVVEALAVPAIRAGAETRCDTPQATHVVTVWLEKKEDGEWKPKFIPGGDPNARCAELPPASPWIKCDFVYYGCAEGEWRTRAMVAGSGLNGKPWAFEPGAGPSKRVRSCPKATK